VHQQNGTPGAPPLRQDTSNISISHALSLYPASHHMFLDGRIRKMVHQAHHLHHDTSNISSHALTSSCVPCNILSHALTHPASHALSQAMHSLHPASHRVSGRVALRLGHVSCRAAPQERGAVPTAKDKGVCRERKAGRQAGRKQVKEEGGCTAGSSESRSKRRVAVLPAHQLGVQAAQVKEEGGCTAGSSAWGSGCASPPGAAGPLPSCHSCSIHLAGPESARHRHRSAPGP